MHTHFQVVLCRMPGSSCSLSQRHRSDWRKRAGAGGRGGTDRKPRLGTKGRQGRGRGRDRKPRPGARGDRTARAPEGQEGWNPKTNNVYKEI